MAEIVNEDRTFTIREIREAAARLDKDSSVHWMNIYTRLLSQLLNEGLEDGGVYQDARGEWFRYSAAQPGKSAYWEQFGTSTRTGSAVPARPLTRK